MPSKGEIYAGIRQNNPELAEIQQIRGVVAALIDNLEAIESEDPMVRRAIAVAQTKFEEGCMMAVKAVYMSNQ